MDTAEWISTLRDKGELWRFYKSKQWIRLKTQVLMDNHYECRICKQQGKVTRYDISSDGRRRRLSTVHHVKEVRKHPDLALSRYYIDSKGISHENLIPICKQCHNKIHDRKFEGAVRKHDHFINQERW